MSEFRFAEPQYLHLIWALGLAAVLLFWLEGRGRAVLARLVDQTMQSRLASRPSRVRRMARIGLICVAGLAMIVALMRPQWGITTVKSSRAGAEIMICLDVSRSMLAEDVVPNRLERAKAEIRDLLTLLDGDQVGLIAFAGRATVLSPQIGRAHV